MAARRRSRRAKARTKPPTASHRPFAAALVGLAAGAPNAGSLSHPTSASAAREPAAREPKPTSFADHVADVVPLPPSRRAPPPEPLAPLPVAQPEPEPFHTFDDGDTMEGRRASLRVRELRRIFADCPVVQSTLDLHGMRLDEAHRAVGRLLQQRALRGGVVLLIHGRGKRSPGGKSVLRAEIAGWLTEGPYARRVAAFVTAPPALGGRGALLVLVSKE